MQLFCFFTLKIENTKGEIFELTHNTKDYVVAGVQGLTRPSTTINTSACAGIDGSHFNSARIEQRNIVIDLILRGDIESNRQKLYTIFPAKTPCTVYFKNHNRDVKIKGYVETLEGDIFQIREQMQISIICPKPFWEDMQAIYNDLSSISNRFHFPFSIEEPVPVAEINGSHSAIIENTGDVETGFICHIFMQAKQNPTLTRTAYDDPLPDECRKCYAYIPITSDEYNPKTDTLYLTSDLQPSSYTSARYITVNGTRYLERVYKTDQTGSTKTLDFTRAEGVPATDLFYFEHTWDNLSFWFDGTVYDVEKKERLPDDFSKSYVEIWAKRGNTVMDAPLPHEDYKVSVIDGKVTVELIANLNSYNYSGLKIIIVSSDSGIDVSRASGIRRTQKVYRWHSEISWYACNFENYDREKDLLKVYDGGELRTDYSIETLSYENGDKADFIFFQSPITGDITYEVIRSLSGEDIRNFSDNDIDAGMMLVDYLKITNETTGQTFCLDYQFQNHDEITINTKSGELGVILTRGDETTNLMKYMTGDSTWIKLASGSNLVTFSAETNPDFVYAVFCTAALYGGV